MTERYSPKHRLVLADIRRQHKACSRTKNGCHPYLSSNLMTERYLAKHRLVLADIRRQHKACSRTNNGRYPYLNSKLMAERKFTQAQASAS